MIHFYMDDAVPLYALAACAKKVRVDLSPGQKKALSKLVAAIKKAATASRKAKK